MLLRLRPGVVVVDIAAGTMCVFGAYSGERDFAGEDLAGVRCELDVWREGKLVLLVIFKFLPFGVVHEGVVLEARGQKDVGREAPLVFEVGAFEGDAVGGHDVGGGVDEVALVVA